MAWHYQASWNQKGYEWLISGSMYSLKIGNWLEPKSRPSIMAEIRSETLWRLGPQIAVYLLLLSLTQSGAEIKSAKISRVDICTDLFFPSKRWVMDLIKKRVTRACHATPHLHNSTLTGISIGKNKITARLYDKPLEIKQQSKKEWMYEVWGIESVPKDLKIIRVEFQLRREVVKDVGLDEVSSLFDHCDNLWAYCTKKWLKFQNNPGKHHTQRKTFKWWKIIQNGFLGVQEPIPLIRCKTINAKKKDLSAQAYGAFKSFIALCAEEMDLPMDYEVTLSKAIRY